MFPTPLFHLVTQPQLLSSWIQDHLSPDYDLPFLVELGCVYLNHKRVAPRNPSQIELQAQDILRIHPQPRRYRKPFAHFSEIIVQENEDFVIIDKPSGVPVHPTLDNLHENLLTWGRQDLQRELHITHRLDLGTSGLMVYAKSTQAQTCFNQFLQDKQVQKHYRAKGTRLQPETSVPLMETWLHWMKPSYRAPKEVLPVEFPEGIRCESMPLKIENWGDQISVDLDLITGRTHQIRAQMAALGWPIDGDLQYGSKVNPPERDVISLRCIFLSFPGMLQNAKE